MTELVQPMALARAEGPKRVPPAAGMAWVLTVVLLLLCQVGVCVSAANAALDGQNDMRAFYAAGTIVRSGHATRLYDYDFQRKVQDTVVGRRSAALPFLYPPFAALLFVPLSLLGYRTALLFFCMFNVGLLVLAAWLLAPWIPALDGKRWFYLPLIYACVFAVAVALAQGQMSFFLLVVFCGCYGLLRRDRHVMAGVVLSFALIKFQLALPVFLLFLL